MIRLLFLYFLFFLITSNSMAVDFKMLKDEKWSFFSDQVMGGKSTGSIKFLSSEKDFIRMSGNVSTENNGGFIQVRHKIKTKINKDASKIIIDVKGNNEYYYIHLRTKGTILPWQYYSKKFYAADTWNSFEIDLSDFKRSSSFLRKKIKPSSIKSIAIVAFGKNHKALIEISSINII